MIVHGIFGTSEALSVMTLEPELEALLQRSASSGGGAVEPGLLDRLQRALADAAERQEAAGRPAVLVVGDAVRCWLARFVRFGRRTLHVLSFAELPDNKQISIVANIGAAER